METDQYLVTSESKSKEKIAPTHLFNDEDWDQPLSKKPDPVKK